MDDVMWKFFLLALFPVIITGLCVQTRHIYKNMKRKIHEKKEYIYFFWEDWILWYCALVAPGAWIIVWIYSA